MLPQKCLYFLRRFIQMGPKTAGMLMVHRIKKYRFATAGKKRWEQGLSYHRWEEIADKHRLPPFHDYFAQLQTAELFQKIWDDPLFQQHIPETYEIPTLDVAEWHIDTTTSIPSPMGWKTDFYRDISIASMCAPMVRDGTSCLLTMSADQSSAHPEERCLHRVSKGHIVSNDKNTTTRLPDIKTPWELSRFQHLFPLGLAYHHNKTTDPIAAQIHAQTFINTVSIWHQENPFLQGVNWVNPMEVALRAINFLWAFYFFRSSLTIPLLFWEKFICMLHGHALYLASNWEVSDRPNNHYLSDLVGSLYLRLFLIDIKFDYQTHHTVAQKVLHHFSHQLLPDKTSYEGSTHYHKLVTELFLHVLLLCKHAKLKMEQPLTQTYASMMHFLQDCTDHGGSMVQIGDNDGGKVLTGIQPAAYVHSPSPAYNLNHYPHFGLSLVRTNRWHFTFRHPTYAPHQPTGHFHHDELSFTLSIDGIPLFVDPGTYLYTAQPTMRNYLRSAAAHNSFFIEGFEGLPKDLFQLHRRPHEPTAAIKKTNEMFYISDRHEVLEGYVRNRTIHGDVKKNRLTISDHWSHVEKNKTHLKSTWTLHLGPAIVASFETGNQIIVYHKKRAIVAITSTLTFECEQDIYSPTYGIMVTTTTLTACAQTYADKQTIEIQPLD